MKFHISEDMVQEAFDRLREGEHAKARAMFVHAEKQLKAVVAQEMMKAEGALGKREMEALASERYQEALDQFKAVSEHYYALQDQREAASAIIEGWRTQQSDLRAAGRVG